MSILFYNKAIAGFLLVAINLFFGIVLIAGAELVFGNWFESFVPPYAAVVNKSLRYNQQLYDPPGEILYTRDRYGLRGVHEPLEAIELVTVGGSTTDQRYITDGETWQDALRARSGVRVANAGVDGMTSYGHLIGVSEWLHKIPKLTPKCYLHYMGMNDASLIEDRKMSDYDRSGKLEARWLKGHWRETLLNRSAIVRAFITLREWSLPPNPRPGSPVGHSKISPGTDKMTKVDFDHNMIERFIETEYKPNLRKLITLHRQRKETAIFLSQVPNPSFIHWKNGETFVAADSLQLAQFGVALGMINFATETICRESADVCHFIDLVGAVKFIPQDYYDIDHTTPSGATKIGTYLSKELGFLCRVSH